MTNKEQAKPNDKGIEGIQLAKREISTPVDTPEEMARIEAARRAAANRFFNGPYMFS